MDSREYFSRAHREALAEWKSTPGSAWEDVLLKRMVAAHRTSVKVGEEKLRQAVLDLPDRDEWLGGQRFKYVKKATVLELIDEKAEPRN